MPKYRRGSGSVYKKRGVFYIAYYTPDGKQVCESARTKDKVEARRILQARLGQLAEGRYVGPAAERVTFEELAEGLIVDYEVNGRKDVRMIKSRLKNPSNPVLCWKDCARHHHNRRESFHYETTSGGSQ